MLDKRDNTVPPSFTRRSTLTLTAPENSSFLHSFFDTMHTLRNEPGLPRSQCSIFSTELRRRYSAESAAQKCKIRYVCGQGALPQTSGISILLLSHEAERYVSAVSLSNQFSSFEGKPVSFRREYEHKSSVKWLQH